MVFFAFLGALGSLIFQKLTKNEALGLLCGVLVAAVVQSEAVQIFYDYIRLMDLFVFAAVYFFLCYFGQGGERAALIGTAFATLAALCKQSSGLVFLVFCFAAVQFFSLIEGRYRAALSIFLRMLGVVSAVLAPFACYLVAKGALGACLRSCFLSSLGAKGGGGVLSLLFGWIGRSATALLWGAFFLLAVFLGILVGERIRRRSALPWQGIPLRPAFVGAVLVMLTVLPFLLPVWGYLLSLGPHTTLQYAIFLCCTLLFAALGIYGVRGRERALFFSPAYRSCLFLSGTVVALGFSVGMSGGLVRSQLALGYALVPVILFRLAARHRRTVGCVLALSAMLWQTAGAFALKAEATYNWWGLRTGSYHEQKYTCELPLLRGIRMSEVYARTYNEMLCAVQSATGEGEPIFVFPHMPVLYLALDRPRASATALQWFDVASDGAVLADIERLKNRPPRAMVLCLIDGYVIQSHERAFRGGERSGLSQMQDFLWEFAADTGYECALRHTLPDGYEISVWILPDPG